MPSRRKNFSSFKDLCWYPWKGVQHKQQ